MGYSYGTKWNNDAIENGIKEVMQKAHIDFMPTHTIIRQITGDYCLTNAIRRHGGTRYWADKLGLEIKFCESKYGYEYECECVSALTELGYECELTKERYPYDILADGNIKVDVKISHLYHGKTGNFYTFNLEKSKPTCDIFVCYCVADDKKQKVYVIPSCVVSGKTQLSIGQSTSRYDKYIDKWEAFRMYSDFYKSLVG